MPCRTQRIPVCLLPLEETHASRFVIPFDRQELADYLSVDRSAMCAELSRMKRDGLIDYNRNQFEIVRRSAL